MALFLPTQELIDYLESRKLKASGQPEEQGGEYWYFPILGLRLEEELEQELENENLIFDSYGWFKKVKDPPDPKAFFQIFCDNDPQIAAEIASYSSDIGYELALKKLPDDTNTFNLAQLIVYALRVKNRAKIFVPVAANCSWSVLPATGNPTLSIKVIEDIPREYKTENPILVSRMDFQWVFSNLPNFAKLYRDKPGFHLAVDSIATYHLESKPPLMLAALWIGIEALFGIDQELKFRLSAYSASILDPDGGTRHDKYQQVQKLYDFRSRVVHGSVPQPTETELNKNIDDAWKLLYYIQH